jgi:FkbM family methyltransferase
MSHLHDWSQAYCSRHTAKERLTLSNLPRKTAFVLAASDHGTLIVSRLDYARNAQGDAWGVGFQVLEHGSHDKPEIDQVLALLARRRAHFGDGVVAVDCGANFGVHSIEWAKQMTGWGRVIAIEAQERVFYALAGNIAINNCLNARAINAAVGAEAGRMSIPVPNYCLPANLGGLELRPSARNEFIGQTIDYADGATAEVACITVDGFGLPRLDLLKIDVESMEPEVLDGARATIEAHLPIVVAEHIKCGWSALADRLTPFGYALYRTPMNLIAVHPNDPTSSEINQGLRA